MKQTLLLSLVLIGCHFSPAQNYNAVDDIVLGYPDNFNSIKTFSERIQKDFNTDVDKVRAVYFWISNHIKYDYKSLSRKNKSQTYKDDTELTLIQRRYAEKVLKRKLGVCEGYSQLMKFVLNELNIETKVITGYAKRFPKEIGKIRNSTNHAWNAVKVDGKWQLIDATWSTATNANDPEHVDFKETYFFIAAKDLLKSHLPQEEKWQLLDKPMTKSEFFYQPLFYEPYFNSGLELSEENLGILRIKTDDFIRIPFDIVNKDNSYYYAFKNDKTTRNLDLEEVEKGHLTQIPFNSNRNDILTIYHDFNAVLAFKIIVDK
ncbi:MAG: transglutaminase domain-containing protein [Bacteroidota bacterium]